MLLLVYSSKHTSWQPDRSLQQHWARSLIYAAFSVFFCLFYLSHSHPPPSFSYFLVKAYIACSALTVLLHCNSCKFCLFLFTILTKPPFSAHPLHLLLLITIPQVTAENICARFEFDSQECILWLLKQPALRLPVVRLIIQALFQHRLRRTFIKLNVFTIFPQRWQIFALDKVAKLLSYVSAFTVIGYVVIYFLQCNAVLSHDCRNSIKMLRSGEVLKRYKLLNADFIELHLIYWISHLFKWRRRRQGCRAGSKQKRHFKPCKLSWEMQALPNKMYRLTGQATKGVS